MQIEVAVGWGWWRAMRWKLVIGMKEVRSEGTSEVKAKGLGGPVAWKDRVMGGAKLVVTREVRAPRGVSRSREETTLLNGGRA